jgi:hypothetical protein
MNRQTPTTFTTGRFGEATEFRIAGDRAFVDVELDRIVDALDADRAWLRIMGPYQWGGEWIVHGVLREKPTREKSKK